MTAAYFARVQMVDLNIGRLEKDRRLDDTLIVFSADHDNMLGDHGRWFKGVLHEGSSRISLLGRVPPSHPAAAAFNGGKAVDEIVADRRPIPLVPPVRTTWTTGVADPALPSARAAITRRNRDKKRARRVPLHGGHCFLSYPNPPLSGGTRKRIHTRARGTMLMSAIARGSSANAPGY